MSKPSRTLFRLKILIYSIAFLLLSSCSFIKHPEATPFVAHWELMENDQGELKACLSQEETEKLRQTLIDCHEDYQ